MRAVARVLTLVALVAALAGCGTQPVDRAGGTTLVLTLGTLDGVINVNDTSFPPRVFIHELEQLSKGTISVKVTYDVGHASPDAETLVVRKLQAGRFDLGYPATRAFAAAGIHGLEPVEAPFVLTNADAVRALITGDGERVAEQALQGSGLTGLALASSGLRRPFTKTAPVLSPEAWQGTKFRVYDPDVQADTVRALGGQPVRGTHNWQDMIDAGRLDGVEIGADNYDDTGGTSAPHATTNVVLWPKIFFFVVNEQRFRQLTDTQRGWIRTAADRARTASLQRDWDSVGHLVSMCLKGVQFATATDAQLAALRSAVAPVSQRLREDPRTSALMRDVEQAATAHPGIDALVPPRDCKARAAEPDDQPPSDLPDGVYRVDIPDAAVEAAGMDNGGGWSGSWTLKVRKAAYLVYCRPLEDAGRDCGHADTTEPVEAGRLVGRGHSVYFVHDDSVVARLTDCNAQAGECPKPDPAPWYSSTWHVDGDTLTFGTAGRPASSNLDIRPWVRVH